jgi:hypothetical protein
MLRDVLGQAVANLFVNDLVKASPDVRAIAVSDCFYKKVAQSAAWKRRTKDVEYLPSKGPSLFF